MDKLTYLFTVRISYAEYMQYYSGAASTVIVKTDAGHTLQLPAEKFRPFLTHSGIRGRFRLTADENKRFKQLELIN
ncbi:hypothetical protein CS022_04390 [Veronia nyctiphanis]|uniref:DUF2835 domain-containing protein n=1 Tax=Veronia nyctiphanis TaxID=1278244 RepID=A0A4Q0YZ43_9GAMM|nr:DUF2835 domain-containing protein [Veronia nyctiphanis]RXJ74391.1 hypothetical protein CS022_04390 [Veronia nyctiphanis]